MPSTITVLNTDDSGPGSLRAAITQADLDPAQDTIDFAPSVTGTITLLSALPDLSTAIILSGPGSSALTVSRSAAAYSAVVVTQPMLRGAGPRPAPPGPPGPARRGRRP